MTGSEQPYTSVPTDVPTPARMYDYVLGGKDNLAIDREAVVTLVAAFPEGLDIPRQNRLFLYRVVRYLAQEVGIRQFLDLGSGLPTQANVHEVAQRFQPDARVVYVDSDPIVLAHGRALLADNLSTTVVTADLTRPREVLAAPELRRLVDLDQPTAALMLSVPHSITDDERARDTVATIADALIPGSYLALSQFVGMDRETAAAHTTRATELGLEWKTRTAEEVGELVAGLEPVPPGLVNVADWRPSPDQPPLRPVDERLRPYLGAASGNTRLREFGGVLRKA